MIGKIDRVMREIDDVAFTGGTTGSGCGEHFMESMRQGVSIDLKAVL
jgi:hypothetical protein